MKTNSNLKKKQTVNISRTKYLTDEYKNRREITHTYSRLTLKFLGY